MRTYLLATLAVFGVEMATAAARGAEIKVEPDKENVVASRLEGRWQVDPALTKRLTGRERAIPAEGAAEGTLSFHSNPAVAAKIPAKYGEFLAKKRVYMAGTLRISGGKVQEFPFLLIENRGNPHVVIFRERDGNPLGDAESFNVMLAVAKEKVNDLLFTGGDFNNEPFSAYTRVPVEKK